MPDSGRVRGTGKNTQHTVSAEVAETQLPSFGILSMLMHKPVPAEGDFNPNSSRPCRTYASGCTSCLTTLVMFNVKRYAIYVHKNC